MLFLPRSLWQGEGIMLALGSLEMQRGGLQGSNAMFGELVFLFSVVANIRVSSVFVCVNVVRTEKSLSHGDAAPWG